MSNFTEEFDITDSQLEEIRTWGSYQRRIKKFVINSTTQTFNEIFGEDDGERLRSHFLRLNNNMTEFVTYLTSDQANELYVYIIKNYKNY